MSSVTLEPDVAGQPLVLIAEIFTSSSFVKKMKEKEARVRGKVKSTMV